MSGQFTGRHMAAVLVTGFGIVIAVNFTMAALASSSFGGLVVENSYVASQKYNGWLEEARQEEALGWSVDIARTSDGRVQVTSVGAPAGVTVRGDAWHPLGRMPDLPLQFAAAGDRTFISTQSLPEGRWRVRLELSHGSQRWRGERHLP